jgi:lysozyme
MFLSPQGRFLIQSFEGFSERAYRDAAGWSIGYGHYLGEGDHSGETVTREQADLLFARDIAKFELAVSTVVPTDRTTQNQFDAMVSLAYNVGTGAFAGSTVARLHNMGDWQGAGDAFRMWNKSQGAVNQALVKRREQEREVYLNGYGQTSPTHFPEPPLEQSAQPEPSSSGAGDELESQGGWQLSSSRAPKLLLATLFGGAGWALWALLRK